MCLQILFVTCQRYFYIVFKILPFKFELIDLSYLSSLCPVADHVAEYCIKRVSTASPRKQRFYNEFGVKWVDMYRMYNLIYHSLYPFETIREDFRYATPDLNTKYQNISFTQSGTLIHKEMD